MTLLAAFLTLLSRYTQQEDVVVGIASSGWNPAANNLVFRADISGDPTFRELLRRHLQLCRQMCSGEDAPLLSHGAGFEVMFACQTVSREAMGLGDVAALAIEFQTRMPAFDFRLLIRETPDGGLMTLESGNDLFEGPLVRRLVANFRVLIEGVIENPDRRISRFPVLTDEERDTLLIDWNATDKRYPMACVHQLFEAQAERTPDRDALVFGERKLSYAELNTRSNQLARYLVRKGAAAGTLVGIYMDRSPEMVVALFGILKAGAAYVPYDTQLPPSGLAVLLHDSSPACVVTQKTLLGKVAAHDGPVISLDSDWDRIKVQSGSNLNIATKPSDPIYAIYTSGSTGIPKAAINTHAGVANRILWGQDQYRLSEADRVLQKTPYTFDVSVWEFFWPLLTGATLVIAEPGGHKDPVYLSNLIAKEQITIIHFVPSMLREFLSAAPLEHCRSLKLVFCSGEALTPELREAASKELPAKLHNLYGPTEAAVEVTSWDCSQKPPCGSVPIGRPIANVKIYILDHHLAPVPIGGVGELYIGGIAVGRGYLNRPDLTAAQFVQDPFVADPEARIYKTGDRARYLPDGSIEYLGRLDTQVKLQGIRIELGEIEATLLQAPHVRAAAVIVREDRSDDKRLVGYVVTDQTNLDAPTLRAFLEERLPAYKVPTALVFLDSLPLTASGKLDRKALPIPPRNTAFTEREFVDARGDVEVQLKRVWEEVLGIFPIGVTDNFFDLGGRSILAVRLLSAVKETCGIQLPLGAVYQAPTIESLARLLAEGCKSAGWPSLVRLGGHGSGSPLYFVPGIGGGLELFRNLAHWLGTDRPIYALQPNYQTNPDLPITSIEEMADHCIREIRTLQPDGPYYVSGYSLGGLIAFEMAQQLTAERQEVAFLGLIDTSVPFKMKRPETWALVARSTAAPWHRRLAEILRSGNMVAWIAAKVRQQTIRLYRRLGRRLHLPLPQQLRSLEGRQAFAADTYVGRPYRGPVTVFRALQRPINECARMGWESFAEGQLEVLDVPGDHLTMGSSDHIPVLAEKFRSCLS